MRVSKIGTDVLSYFLNFTFVFLILYLSDWFRFVWVEQVSTLGPKLYSDTDISNFNIASSPTIKILFVCVFFFYYLHIFPGNKSIYILTRVPLTFSCDTLHLTSSYVEILTACFLISHVIQVCNGLWGDWVLFLFFLL